MPRATVWPPGYRPVRRIGAGRLTEVTLLEDPAGRAIAVKGLKAELTGHAGARAALRHEHDALRAVQGPGVVVLYGWLDGAPGRALAMEYLPGGDLLALIGAPVSTWRQPLAALAAAVDDLHRRGWVHRDIRPENALFRTAACAVWIDFSAAGRATQDAGPLSRGSPAYASPEQRAGLNPSPRDDVYSFGALLYHLMWGTPPGAAASLAGRPRKAEDEPRPLRAWIAAALAESRSARPANLRAIADILENI